MRLRITLYPIYQTDLMNVAEKREFCAVFGCGVRRSTRNHKGQIRKDCPLKGFKNGNNLDN